MSNTIQKVTGKPVLMGIATGLFLIVATFALPACRNTQPAPGAAGAPAAAGEPAVQVLYTCPMHPEVVRSGPGKCPKCGMNLVPRK